MPTVLKPDDSVRKVDQVIDVHGQHAKSCGTDLHRGRPLSFPSLESGTRPSRGRIIGRAAAL